MAHTGVSELGTILSVWAHPDDEGYCCGGLMAMAVRGGQRVVCVTATRGELGSTDPDRWPAGKKLAKVRTKELAKTLGTLGISEHHWLDYPDGGCDAVDDEKAAARLRAIIDDCRPDTVLTFGPDGGTYHPDHIAVSRWVSAAVDGTRIRVLHMAHTPAWQAEMESVIDSKLVMMADLEPVTLDPEEMAVYLDLDGEWLDLKFAAMQAMESQIGPLVAIGGVDLYRKLLAEEAFTDARPA